MVDISLIIVKPDAVVDNKYLEIKSFLLSKGMRITQEERVWFTAEQLKEFYTNNISDESFEKMVKLYKISFAIVIFFKGENAIDIGQEAKRYFRERYNYGYYGSTIHATDGEEDYEREKSIILNIV